MKNFVTALALPGLAWPCAAPAYGRQYRASTCRDIESSKSNDGKTMVFKMKDGRRW